MICYNFEGFMKFLIKVLFLTIMFFQNIICLEASLLNNHCYYAECIRSLDALLVNTDYDGLLGNTESRQGIAHNSLSLENAVIEFSEAILKRTVSPEEVVSFNGDPGKGLSGNPIFKVGIPPKSTLVVKVFKGGNGAFSKEFLTLYTYNQNNIPDLKFPRVQGITAIEINQEQWFLMGMEFIEGTSVNDLFIKLFHLNQGSQERNDLLKLIEQIYVKMGRGLAQFHYQKQESDQPFPSIHLQALQKLLTGACLSLESRAEGGALAQQLKEVIKTNGWQQIISNHFDLGYMHTDIHPGNFIANLETGELYLIDTGTETIGPKGAPIGLPFLDIAQVYGQLSLRSIWGLSEKEIDLLFSSFTQAYKNKVSCFPTSQQMNFFQIVDMLRLFVWYNQVEDTLDTQSQKIIGQIYQYSLEKCPSIIESFKK